MRPPRRIVLGLDLDPSSCCPTAGSLAACETALWLAEPGESHVTLLHSVVRDEYFDPLANELVPICDTVVPEARLAVSELVGRFRAHEIPCETLDVAERPSLAIAREVQQQGAELVLLGKHDGREADASRIGPIALRALRESPCAVWTVVPGRPSRPRRVLAATDLTATGAHAVEWAALIAARAEAELHIAHIQPPTLHTRGADSEAHRRKLEATACAPLGEAQRARVQMHLREAAPAQGLLALVEELDIDLITLGAFSHRRDTPGVIGSTAERLIPRIECALLMVRQA